MLSYIITFAVGAVIGALVGYYALRNNPKVKAALDAENDKRGY